MNVPIPSFNDRWLLPEAVRTRARLIRSLPQRKEISLLFPLYYITAARTLSAVNGRARSNLLLKTSHACLTRELCTISICEILAPLLPSSQHVRSRRQYAYTMPKRKSDAIEILPPPVAVKKKKAVKQKVVQDQE